MNPVQIAITITGGLALFLFGMKLMSEGLQKVAGAKMRRVLSVMTNNRVAGVGTGFVVTTFVQSSSATTVMLVGFVSAGLITLTQSIGVIMGANIGTTFTGWLVALIGFKVKINIVALVAIALGFFPRFFGARRLADWGEVLIGFGVLFIGLNFMKDSVGDLRDAELIREFMGSCRADVIHWRLVAVVVGAAVTMIIQSSSATMVITMTLVSQQLIDIETACALVLGENIGTTITANIAAIGTPTAAKQTARAHLLFNISGAIWAVLLFTPFLSMVDQIVGLFSNIESQDALKFRLAMFHTVFNIANTAVFLPFVGQIAWLVTKLVRDSGKGSGTRLKYIDPNIVELTPMALQTARSELARMLDEVDSMFGRVMMLISSPEKKLGKIARAIEDSERTVDILEKEITAYLVNVGKLKTSQRQSKEIAGIINAASDIERIGDHCEIILRLLRRRYDEKLALSKNARQDAVEIGDQVARMITLLQKNIGITPGSADPDLMRLSDEIEDIIDEKERTMREHHVERLRAGDVSVDSGLIFIDMLTSFEKIGDHAYNVAEMLAGKR